VEWEKNCEEAAEHETERRMFKKKAKITMGPRDYARHDTEGREWEDSEYDCPQNVGNGWRGSAA
jgi:hypothetical protein